jgi:hypothetical protein
VEGGKQSVVQLGALLQVVPRPVQALRVGLEGLLRRGLDLCSPVVVVGGDVAVAINE